MDRNQHINKPNLQNITTEFKRDKGIVQNTNNTETKKKHKIMDTTKLKGDDKHKNGSNNNVHTETIPGRNVKTNDDPTTVENGITNIKAIGNNGIEESNKADSKKKNIINDVIYNIHGKIDKVNSKCDKVESKTDKVEKKKKKDKVEKKEGNLKIKKDKTESKGGEAESNLKNDVNEGTVINYIKKKIVESFTNFGQNDILYKSNNKEHDINEKEKINSDCIKHGLKKNNGCEECTKLRRSSISTKSKLISKKRNSTRNMKSMSKSYLTEPSGLEGHIQVVCEHNRIKCELSDHVNRLIKGYTQSEKTSSDTEGSCENCQCSEDAKKVKRKNRKKKIKIKIKKQENEYRALDYSNIKTLCDEAYGTTNYYFNKVLDSNKYITDDIIGCDNLLLEPSNVLICKFLIDETLEDDSDDDIYGLGATGNSFVNTTCEYFAYIMTMVISKCKSTLKQV